MLEKIGAITTVAGKLTVCRGPAAIRTLFAGAALLMHAAALPQDFDRTGARVAEASCMPCHATGVNGAPRVGDQKAWEPLARRQDSLTKSALEGIRNMPAHGGERGFSDTEIASAIAYMLTLSGYSWIASGGSTRLVQERTGEQVVATHCIECHSSGRYGAPRIGDRGAWLPLMKGNLTEAVESAIKGHHDMPARGGMAGLSDTEVRAAVVQMYRAAGWP